MRAKNCASARSCTIISSSLRSRLGLSNCTSCAAPGEFVGARLRYQPEAAERHLRRWLGSREELLKA